MLGEKQFPLPVFLVLFIIAIILATFAIGKFFNVSLASYLPYITWIVALGLLFLILPKNVGNIFQK